MTIYTTGTVSVANGDAVVTGSGTAWAVALIAGGMFSSAGLSVPIASVDSDTSLTLAYDWPGATAAGAVYAIARENSEAADIVDLNDKLSRVLVTLSLVGITPNASGTIAERDALTLAVGDKGFLFLHAEPGVDLAFYRWSGSAWQGPFATRGTQGVPGIGSGGYGLPAGGASGQFLLKASGTDGDAEWASDINQSESGHFYAGDGARIQRLADRVFIGPAVANSGEQVADAGDWLTDFQLAVGRSRGFIQRTQAAVLNGGDPEANHAWISAAQSKDATVDGYNAIGDIAIGINNNTTKSLSAYARYTEAYRMAGAVGGAYGHEIDAVNFASEVDIDPWTQNIGQTVGEQMAAGAELSPIGQFAISAGWNLRKNGSTFLKALIIGNDAIKGTDGTDGNVVHAINLVPGHAIDYWSAAGQRSWRLYAGVGVNGDYRVETSGTGALSVSRNSAALPAAIAGTTLRVSGADGSANRVLVDSFGAGGSALSLRTARGTAAAPTATQNGDPLINVGGFGYGATGYSATASAGFLAVATENWTDAAHGAEFSIRTTPNGTTTLSTIVTVRNNGLIDILGGSLGLGAPSTKTASFTLGAAENSIICNGTGSITVTLPSPSAFIGRVVRIKNIAAFTVVSASSNVIPLAGGAAGTAILAATAGKWADLQSDGTNWIVVAGS
ncbi:hypothetical protein [Mesorhizobium sp. WSM3862]|uniref:hypothetical protein n=1 Tax=Mesorhizobium sp. WSM3862 TaxID=632858 RepID=UPI000BAF313C|nr:hypothetical protein [Mesorhizobium sp. WSM3862]PBB94983.1 hypothetical protein CK224_29235 [Mesorhizobium sp. WSM3862]